MNRDGDDGWQDGPSHFTLNSFREYLKYKYGNVTRATKIAQMYFLKIMAGHFSGIEDPKLREDLLNRKSVCKD